MFKLIMNFLLFVWQTFSHYKFSVSIIFLHPCIFLKFPYFQSSTGILPVTGYSGIYERVNYYIALTGAVIYRVPSRNNTAYVRYLGKLLQNQCDHSEPLLFCIFSEYFM